VDELPFAADRCPCVEKLRTCYQLVLASETVRCIGVNHLGQFSYLACPKPAVGKARPVPQKSSQQPWISASEWSYREAAGGIPESAREPSPVYPAGRVGTPADPNIAPGRESRYQRCASFKGTHSPCQTLSTVSHSPQGPCAPPSATNATEKVPNVCWHSHTLPLLPALSKYVACPPYCLPPCPPTRLSPGRLRPSAVPLPPDAL
jgi:hypothetical protein